MEIFAFIISNHETIRNLGLVITAIVALPLMLWRTSIANRQAKTGEANHISDIFNKSIEQLGANNESKPSIERRIGAIFALEKIAINNHDYYSQVIDVLCAYIRLHAPITKRSNELHIKIREDIQVALTVIGRCLPKNINTRPLINLSNTDLRRADLTGANLEGAELSCVNFYKARLEKANFTEAELMGADLKAARLMKTNFTNANLKAAKLEFADLTQTNFNNTNLIAANLDNTIIKNTNFEKSTGQYNMFNQRSGTNWKTLDLKNLTFQDR
ncbi:MAG: pentapeptide repeat-containing protein [Alteromonadaceae bacterium]|nr:pentapeptide repeat-containing protein [Alteromonadaceae bacterium]